MTSKYHAVRTGKYASKKEARVASELAMLQRAGNISELKEQVPFTLLEGSGGVRGIKYIADFTWIDLDTGKYHVGDAKGMRTPVYDLKKKMMFLLLGVTVEEL